jgi:hypothetical protein
VSVTGTILVPFDDIIDIDDPFFGPLVADATRTADQRIRVQSVGMRLDTATGTFELEPEYGLALSGYVLEGLSSDALARMPFEVGAQLELDDEIASTLVTPTATRLPSGRAALTLGILITPTDGSPDQAITVTP